MNYIGFVVIATLVVFYSAACGPASSSTTESVSPESSQPTSSQSDGGAASTLNAGKLALDFEMKDLDGNIVKLSDFKGKKVCLEFWASWCGICVSNMPQINEMAEGQDEFVFLTIVAPGAPGEKSEEKFREWFAALPDTGNMVVLLDEKGSYNNKNGIRAFPTFHLIGTDGVLVKQFPGFPGAERLLEEMGKVQ